MVKPEDPVMVEVKISPDEFNSFKTKIEEDKVNKRNESKHPDDEASESVEVCVQEGRL